MSRLVFSYNFHYICQRNIQPVYGHLHHHCTVCHIHDVFTDILYQPLDLADTLQIFVFIMPFALACDDTYRINGCGAITGKNNITYLHTVHKGVQHYLAAICSKVCFIGNVLAVIIPANTDMPIFETFGTDGIIACSIQRNLPDIGVLTDAKIFCICNGRTVCFLTKPLENTGLHTIPDFTSFAAGFFIGGNHRLDSFDEFFITVGLMECGKFDTALCLVFIVPFENFCIVFSFDSSQLFIFDNCYSIDNRMISLAGARRAVQNSIQTNIRSGFFLRFGIRNLDTHKCLFQFITEFPGITFITIFGNIAPHKRNNIHTVSFNSITLAVGAIWAVKSSLYLLAIAAAQFVVIAVGFTIDLSQMRTGAFATQL